MDPSSVGSSKVSTDGTKWQPISPDIWLGSNISFSLPRQEVVDSLLIDTLYESREDIGLGVRSTGSKQDVVWVPVD